MSMKHEIKGNTLTITVDVSDAAIKAASASKSGKSKLVASTGGFTKVSDQISYALNVIAPTR
jgi:hypothetical protein